ncbi:MAG: porin [Reichenbachiella sp.]|uniref:porin n=1 Tax=Reichenbachiella sp. TaxID=2184521 RepID=UPI0029663744|nr:porin [Reichenbachiella sp.]MDW3212185.1 porin [Reichenbachiella sp.]
MKIVYIWQIIATLILYHVQAYGQNEIELGNGINYMSSDSSFFVRFNSRFQTQYMGRFNLKTNSYQDQFTIRRFRLKATGYVYKPQLQYKMELALSNRDQGDFFAEHNYAASIVLDAVLKWNFHPNWSLWIGQAKLPGNRERLFSSKSLSLPDRSVLNSRYNIDRDKGIWVRHYHELGTLALREIFSITSGEGRNITSDNSSGYDYTFRIEVMPFGLFTNKGDYFGADLIHEKTPKLSIGTTYDHNFGTNRQRGQLGFFLFNDQGDPQRSDLATIFVDAIFKYIGGTIHYEYANKRLTNGDYFGYSSNGQTILYFYTGFAHNIHFSYLLTNKLSFEFRSTFNRPNQVTSIDGAKIHIEHPENRYEFGLSKYFVEHTLKIQGSTIYRNRWATDDELIVLLQMEIGF